MRKLVLCAVVFCFVAGVRAACPQADLDGNCRVDLRDFAKLAQWWLNGCAPGDCDGADLDTSGAVGVEDLAMMAAQWLTVGQPDASAIVWVDINEPGGFVGQMSRYLITNAQYAAFLAAALDDALITITQDEYEVIYVNSAANPAIQYTVLYPGVPDAQIAYDMQTGAFSIRQRDGFDMSDHPVVNVTWHGAKAFCDYYGYRLPTSAEWQAVADFDGSYIYGCGATINASVANFNDPNISVDGYGNNPLELSDMPYTTPVNTYPAFGYGLNDMAGNALEWTSTVGTPASTRIVHGGSWFSNAQFCTVLYNEEVSADTIYNTLGFRPCR